MSVPSLESTKQSKLRLNAETRLKEGSAPPAGGWPAGVSALNLLHKLASAPDSADDALKLLHELQVHQVELDLQHEQMELTQRELTEDRARYHAFYEFAPVAYLGVGLGGDILEGNVAAAGLLGMAQDELRGRRIDVLLTPESRPPLIALLKRLRADGPSDFCEVQLSSANRPLPLQLMASVAPDGGSFLIVLVGASDRGQPGARD